MVKIVVSQICVVYRQHAAVFEVDVVIHFLVVSVFWSFSDYCFILLLPSFFFLNLNYFVPFKFCRLSVCYPFFLVMMSFLHGGIFILYLNFKVIKNIHLYLDFNFMSNLYI